MIWFIGSSLKSTPQSPDWGSYWIVEASTQEKARKALLRRFDGKKYTDEDFPGVMQGLKDGTWPVHIIDSYVWEGEVN